MIGLTSSVQMNLGFSECEKKKKKAKEKELSREKQQHISSVWCDDDDDGVMRIERISRVIWRKT